MLALLYSQDILFYQLHEEVRALSFEDWMVQHFQHDHNISCPIARLLRTQETSSIEIMRWSNLHYQTLLDPGAELEGFITT